MRDAFLAALAVAFLAIPACTRHSVQVAPIEIKPIHITMDINIKVDKELDEFFDFEDEVTPKPSEKK